MQSILENRPRLRAVIDEVAEVTGYLWQKGWAERNGGNITVNVTELADEAMREMPALAGPFQIGKTLPCLSGMPTSELPSHLELQNYLLSTGSSYRATLHTHPIELVAMSHIKRFLRPGEMTRVLWSMIPETLAFAPLGIGIVPYQLPGSLRLAEATLEQIKTHDVVLWEKHGTVAVGLDIMDAFDQTDVLCKAANIYMCARAMGSEPDGMTEEAIREVQEVFKLPKKREK